VDNEINRISALVARYLSCRSHYNRTLPVFDQELQQSRCLPPTFAAYLQIGVNILIGFLVQCVFARRVQIMSRTTILPVIIVTLAFGYFSLGIYFTIRVFLTVGPSEVAKLLWTIAAAFGCASCADVIIAAALCYYLHKSRTGFARTDSLITTLIVYTLTTGLLTALLAVIHVILFATTQKALVWVGVFWVLGRCYINSLLAALNVRGHLRGQLEERATTVWNLTALRDSTQAGSHNVVKPLSSGADMNKEYPEVGKIAVNVQLQTHTDDERIVSLPSTEKTV